MKPYHVKLRWICSICHSFEDKDFFFGSLYSAKRFLSQSLCHLSYDVAFLLFEGEILIHIIRKEVFNNETQK